MYKGRQARAMIPVVLIRNTRDNTKLRSKYSSIRSKEARNIPSDKALRDQ